MSDPVADVDSPSPTADELAAARRAQRRIQEFNTSIDAWVHRANHAASMANDTRKAKERFVKSLPPSPFWLPTVPK